MASALRRADGAGGLTVAIAMSVAWISWFLPPGFVRGVSGRWQIDGGDMIVYLSGFHAFFSEPWGWPLLRIRGLNAPEGTLATFVDAIPLYASVLKLVVPADRFPFNPYGYWVALGYVLMAVGAWWLLREARLLRYGTLIVLTGLLFGMPALSGRLAMGHIGLTSQWLIVFALALYLRSGRTGRPAWAPWALLLFGAFYVHLYIVTMIGLVFAADVARFGSSLGWRRALGGFLLSVVPILVSLPLTMLPVPHVSGEPESGFGWFSLNLLSPFTDGGRLTSWVTRERLWFGKGHYEGYNYLGAGVLLLIGVAFVLRLRHDRGFFARHRALLAGLILATLFALSNRVHIADRLVLQWPVPSFLEWPAGTFRASGRMFWPVGYALVCFAVLTSARWLAPRGATVVLTLALALQWFDLGPLRDIVRMVETHAGPSVLDPARWDAALGRDVRMIYVEPKYGCERYPESSRGVLALQKYAAERRLSLSTAYIARYHPPCDAVPREVAASDPRQSLYVFLYPEEAAEVPSAHFPPGARLVCRELDIALACRWVASAARP